MLPLLGWALVVPALAQSVESELDPEELSAIEEALAADASASDPVPVPAAPVPTGGAVQSLNPDISFIADVAVAWFRDPDEQLQTGAHDPRVNGFNLQQLELAVGRPVDPYFRFDANIVFSEFGVEIEEVYATTLSLPGRLQLRTGQFLTRFGRQNPTHPHTWDFVDQPLAIGRIFGGEGNRGLGVELSWLAPLPWYVEVLGSQTMIGGEAMNRSWQDFAALGVRGPMDFQTTAAVKQFFPLGPEWSLAWGLSLASGFNGTGRTNRTEVYGSDLYLHWRPITRQNPPQLTLHTEWMHRRRQVPSDLLVDWTGFEALSFRFSQRWGVGLRHELGTGAQSERDTLDPLDPLWTGNRQRVAAAVTYWPTEFSRLRIQGARDDVPWLETPSWAFFTAFEFNVGAHGAHRF